MADLAKIQGQELLHKMVELGNDWQLVNDHHIEKTFKFKDFKEALAFTNRVGELAEKENHHPDILLGYGKVKLTLWTHSIDGLSEKDFILAAKLNSLLSSVK